MPIALQHVVTPFLGFVDEVGGVLVVAVVPVLQPNPTPKGRNLPTDFVTSHPRPNREGLLPDGKSTVRPGFRRASLTGEKVQSGIRRVFRMAVVVDQSHGSISASVPPKRSEGTTGAGRWILAKTINADYDCQSSSAAARRAGHNCTVALA